MYQSPYGNFEHNQWKLLSYKIRICDSYFTRHIRRLLQIHVRSSVCSRRYCTRRWNTLVSRNIKVMPRMRAMLELQQWNFKVTRCKRSNEDSPVGKNVKWNSSSEDLWIGWEGDTPGSKGIKGDPRFIRTCIWDDDQPRFQGRLDYWENPEEFWARHSKIVSKLRERKE